MFVLFKDSEGFRKESDCSLCDSRFNVLLLVTSNDYFLNDSDLLKPSPLFDNWFQIVLQVFKIVDHFPKRFCFCSATNRLSVSDHLRFWKEGPI